MEQEFRDELGFAYRREIPERRAVPRLPEYLCQCGTPAQPYLDAACPIHGRCTGLGHAVAARLRGEAK